MEVYLVGGAVRDQLLGLPIKEKDWVVVGATPESMLSKGFQPVGRSFPVFLHPETKEEYALARTERKVAPGYKGFIFHANEEVTLEEDLQRRDLTINAMAQTESGEIIDPYGGQQDIKDRVFRHVSDAFVEDPVRVLRLARFAARFYDFGFKLAPETKSLVEKIVDSGELSALVPERVWKEMQQALSENYPSAFFRTLEACEALPILFPELAPYATKEESDTLYRYLDLARQVSIEPTIRYASMVYCLDKAVDSKAEILKFNSRVKTPKVYYSLAKACLRSVESILNYDKHDAQSVYSLFEQTDVIRKLDRFKAILEVAGIIAADRGLSFDAEWLAKCAEEVQSVKVDKLVIQGLSHQAIQEKIKELRESTILEFIKQFP